MKKLFVIFLLLFGFSKTAFVQNLIGQKEEKMYSVSLIQLIANPKKYHNKKVQIIGFMNLQFESNGIYLHKEDAEHLITNNGLWLSFLFSNDLKTGKEDLNNKYVLIEGLFDMKMRGHFGMWSGSIKNITRCDEWR